MKNLGWLALVTAVAPFALAGCETTVCGEGTIEKDGVCLPAEEPPPPTCGAGLRWNAATGQCEYFGPDVGVCGEFTERQIAEDGTPTCVGIGGGGCEVPLPCPTPGPNQICVRGRVFSFKTGEPIADGMSDTGLFQDVEVEIHEPIGFVANPNVSPLATVPLDKCGRFVAPGITTTSTNLVAAGVDDPRGGGADNFVKGGSAAEAPRGSVVTMNVWYVTKADDMAVSAGFGGVLGGAATFGAKGVYVPVFVDPRAPKSEWANGFPGKPVSGVKVLVAPAMTIPNNDFYFTDTSPYVRSMLDSGAQDVTGPNGAAFVINTGGLGTYTGSGGNLGPGCKWPTDQAAAVPGVYFVQPRTMVDSTGENYCTAQ